MDLVKIHRTSDWLIDMEAQEIRTMVYTLQALGIFSQYMTSHVRVMVDGEYHSSATLRALEVDGDLVDLNGNIGGPIIRGYFKKEARKSVANGSVSLESNPWSQIDVGLLNESWGPGPSYRTSQEKFQYMVDDGIARLNAMRLAQATPDLRSHSKRRHSRL